MATSFDPNDRKSWYFGRITRQDATDLLMSEKDGGVFLVRDSSSIPGDYVLCVKEDCKVCHYIINKQIDDRDGVKYRIGDRSFPDLPDLLSFYKLHYLDTTPLVRPAVRRLEKVIAKHDFEGQDPEDLPFKRGEVLTVTNKPEEQWWEARNSFGQKGAIPVPYVKLYDERLTENLPITPNFPKPVEPPVPSQAPNHTPRRIEPNQHTYAIVKQDRVPNAYDDTALRLEVGNIIRVTKHNISGQWEGELILEGGKPGRRGHFPFTHVEVLTDYDPVTGTCNNSAKNDSIQKPD
ncbi:unnamed protein product [Allacma fusca]|uniref:Adapter molecule Crk n=1 Tax=Allacma fusca TaxID=39272 RepID=A0A8J2KKU7_9HEXA|nr:unnamed protein product [Allacma fusca]